MYISINWIKDFVNLDGIDVDNLIYKFTMSTAEVEKIEKFGYDTNGVVVGRIESIEKIEDSDKLSKLIVDTKKEKVACVCGAKNIFVGAKIPFAKAGSVVQGVEIENGIINKNESCGVCLSEKELGISLDHSGVMILDDSLEVGEDIKKYIPLEDTIFEVDNKSLTNRPDLWGHYGIAREIAAICKRELKKLDIEDLSKYDNLPKLNIKVENGDNCLRYTGITVENITKNISTYTMKVRLYYTGLRSINLLADITNYVMLEIGQPMHAFDKRFVNSVDVRTLKQSSEFVTLDGITRTLPAGTLMINDGEKDVGIAGIMGGQNTQIMEDTNSLFLESATFDSTLIRKTSTKIAHRTDASARYEKTLDPKFCKLATARYIKLLKDSDKNIEITSSFTDIYFKKYPKITIEIDKEFFDKYIGIDISMETIIETLTNLKYIVTKNGDILSVEVPSFRATKDVSCKADLIEEVARIYGYDNIKPKSNLWKLLPVREDEIKVIEYETKRMLAEKFGLSEVQSYIWYNEEQNKMLNIDVEDNLKIVNGLNKADSTLRKYMGPTMLYYINNNLRYLTDCNIFEVGRVFDYNFDNTNCVEKKVLAVALSSTKQNTKDLLYKAKNIVESIFKIQKNKKVEIRQNDNEFSMSWTHKVNSYSIIVDGDVKGYISQVHPQICDNINKKANIAIIEIRIDNLDMVENNKVIYKQVSKYQTTNFDLTFIVDKNMKYIDIKNVINNIKLDYLLGYSLIDIYENEEKLKNKKSVTVRFNIGSYDKTLLKEEIDEHMNTIINEFEKNGIEITK